MTRVLLGLKVVVITFLRDQHGAIREGYIAALLACKSLKSAIDAKRLFLPFNEHIAYLNWLGVAEQTVNSPFDRHPKRRFYTADLFHAFIHVPVPIVLT